MLDPVEADAFAVALLTASLGTAMLVELASSPLRTQRGFVFVAGSLLLLTGLQARFHAFLHTGARIRTAPLPVSAQQHFRAASRRHAWLLLVYWCMGTLALWGSHVWARGSLDQAGWLLLDWTWLCLHAWLLEPWFAGASAWLGRRHTGVDAMLASAGGGWTLPETAVHLYAPALALATAVAVSLPGQLAFARIQELGALDGGHVAALLVPTMSSIAVRISSLRCYGRGMWEAVAFLNEAERTLSGPPRPEAIPTWISWMQNPVRKLFLLEIYRTTTVPMLRLAVLMASGTWIVTTEHAVVPSSVIVAAAAGSLWLLPVLRFTKRSRERALLFGALPLSFPQRNGRDPMMVIGLCTPALAVLGFALLRWSVG